MAPQKSHSNFEIKNNMLNRKWKKFSTPIGAIGKITFKLVRKDFPLVVMYITIWEFKDCILKYLILYRKFYDCQIKVSFRMQIRSL